MHPDHAADCWLDVGQIADYTMPILTTIKAWAIAIVAAGLITGIALYIHSAEQAKARVIVLAAEKAELIRQNQTGKAAVERCEAVNDKNRLEAEAAIKRAQEAAARSAIKDKEADEEVTRIGYERTQFGNADCPALDDRFRDWLRNE